MLIGTEPPEWGFEKERALEVAARVVTAKGYEVFNAEHGPNGRDPKIFHGPEHLVRMKARGLKLAKVFRLSKVRQLILEGNFAWHDAVIDYTPADSNNLLARITRRRGARKGDNQKDPEMIGNEGKSAQAQKEEMLATKIFSKNQIETSEWANWATYPEVEMGSDYQGVPFSEYPFLTQILEQSPALGAFLEELKTQGVEKGSLFSQPYLEKPLEQGKKVPREVLITALADLGASGMDEKETFFLEGDAEMRELYGNLRKPEVFGRLVNGDSVTDQSDREKVSQAFLKWLKDQASFATWQYLRFEKIVFLLKRSKQLNSREEKDFRDLFSHYEKNIRSALRRFQEVGGEVERIKKTNGEKAAFKYLAKEVGYNF
ncbi:MAG: hypothetical protein V1664_03445 [Candidatus Uhrbacteria bacterium]